MNDLRTAAQQALEAWNAGDTKWFKLAYLVMEDLRRALAEPVQEPVAYSVGRTLHWHQGRGVTDAQLYIVPPQRPAEPVQEQDIEDAIETAYWHFDARKQGLNEWASAPQSERDAFKAEARKLVRGYFPTRQAQDTKREMLAVADAFIRGKRAALAEPVQEPVQEPVASRAFLERILTAMEGVIDVADRKTDEFDALRSCVIDLTLMLHTAPPQRKPLSEEEITQCFADAGAIVKGHLWVKVIRNVERAHGITE